MIRPESLYLIIVKGFWVVKVFYMQPRNVGENQTIGRVLAYYANNI